MQKKTLIKKQLGIIQEMKLRVLFTIFLSNLIEGGFYSKNMVSTLPITQSNMTLLQLIFSKKFHKTVMKRNIYRIVLAFPESFGIVS